MESRAMFLVLMVVAAVVRGSPLPVPVQTDNSDYRLSGDVVPTAYALIILPQYPSSGLYGIQGFQGQLVIDATVEENTQQIELHRGAPITNLEVLCVVLNSQNTARGLSNGHPKDVSEGGIHADRRVHRMKDAIPVHRRSADKERRLVPFSEGCDVGTTIEIDEPTWDEERTEKYIIPLRSPLSKGDSITIILQYDAVFPDGSLTGFYVSNFTSQNRDAAVLATKFQPTHARKAFPCFDEPGLKATFDLRIQIKNGVDAIANTDVESKDGDMVTFKTSPRMPTYLLAFMVYETSTFTATAANNEVTPFRTWARREAIDAQHGAISQTDGPQMIKIMEEYTLISYSDESITKMDQAAIPDFQSGAMENWGLVTYRENALLFNQQEGTTAAHKRVSDIVAHELAHQWFGNLVTTLWWNTTWINEGFANYFEYLLMDRLYPTWRIAERMVLDDQMGVFAADSAENVVAMTIPGVYTPTEIGNHFGSITYNKGGAILRQITNVLGEFFFQRGLQQFLLEKRYDAATPEDLFRNLVRENTERTRLTTAQLTAALQSWTTTPGYPVITVSRINATTFAVSQKRFRWSAGSSVGEKYYVALTWSSSREDAPAGPRGPQAWMTSSQDAVHVRVEGIDADDWVLFNAYQSGYYRVNYDNATWDQLAALLAEQGNLSGVAAVDRAALLDNALHLARAGGVDYARAFRLLRFLRHDADFAPWAAARSALAHFDRLLGRGAAYKNFIKYIVKNVYEEVGFAVRQEDDNVEKTHRINVLTLACSAGQSPCLNTAKRLLSSFLSAPSSAKVDPDLRSVVYCYGLKGDSGNLWDKLWDEYVKADNDAGQRGILTTALGCTNHRKSLEKYLWYSLNSSLVRGQEANSVFTAVYANPEGVDTTIKFFGEAGYETLEQAYGQVRNIVYTIVTGMANRVTLPDQRRRLEEALGDHATKHQAALDAADDNLKWLDENRAVVVAALKASTSGASPSSWSSVTLVLLWTTAVMVLGTLRKF